MLAWGGSPTPYKPAWRAATCPSRRSEPAARLRHLPQLHAAAFCGADFFSVLVSLNELSDGEVLTASICVIGGGAASISLAMEFIGSGIDVTMLESGGLEYDEDTQKLASGENDGLDYFELDTARLRYLGGATNHWAGQSCPLEPNDFLARSWVPDRSFTKRHGQNSLLYRNKLDDRWQLSASKE